MLGLLGQLRNHNDERLQLQIGLLNQICFESEKLQLIRAASVQFRDASASPSIPFHIEHIREARLIAWTIVETETHSPDRSVVSMYCLVHPFWTFFETPS
jgi:hypothetical protein